MTFVAATWFKLEKNFFLTNFGEIEFFLVKWLKNLVNPEFSGTLLQMASFIQLSNKPILPMEDFRFTSGYIVAKKALAHTILPLSKQQIVQERDVRMFLGRNITFISVLSIFVKCIHRKLRHWYPNETKRTQI